MADQVVGVLDQYAGGVKKVDTTEVTVGTNLVERQRVNISDTVLDAHASVSAAAAGVSGVSQGALNVSLLGTTNQTPEGETIVTVEGMKELLGAILRELSSIRLILAQMNDLNDMSLDDDESMQDSSD